jgi:hypothetical protein
MGEPFTTDTILDGRRLIRTTVSRLTSLADRIKMNDESAPVHHFRRFPLIFLFLLSFLLTILLHLKCNNTLVCLHHPYICVDTNDALHFYSHDNAGTSGGKLNISTEQKINDYKAFDEKKKTFYADKKYIQSAMVQSWNKFCFVGGIVEFSAKLPGDPRTGGLWPARESSSSLA